MPQYELNLRDYLRIFRRRRWIIIFTFILVTIVTALYLPKQSPLYEATTTVKIEQGKTIAGLLAEWIQYNPADIMESEPKVIKDYPIINKVALQMNIIKENSPVEEVHKAVTELQDRIETKRIESTNMIHIIATAPLPAEAVMLANTVAKVYIEENVLEKTKQAHATRQFIEEQLASVEARLSRSEDKMKEFSDKQGDVKLSEPIQQKLIALETELAELLQRYTEKHPRVIALREEIKNLKSQIVVKDISARDLEYARLSREIEVNKKIYTMLKEKLEESRISEAQKISDVSVVNPAVSAKIANPSNNKLKILIGSLMGLILGIVLAFVLETMDTSIGTIEDVENVVKLPVLGIIPSIKAELKQKQGLADKLKARVSPDYNAEQEDRSIRLVSHYFPKSFVAEAYRNIQTNLKLNSSKKTIMVTSSGPREGKSNVVTNLGIVMSQAGLKTLLVSADLRRPVLSKAFGIKKEPGLNELIMGTANLETALNNITDIMIGEMKFEDITKTPGIDNIWIIPSGHLPSNPVEVLGSREITNLIEQFKSRFDVVIFDAPPVLLVTDASILAPKMDCVVIVYEIGRTSREALLRTKIQLESTGAKIAGVVLNNTRSQTEDIASYPYYHYKYRYYGKHELSDRDKTEKQEDST